MFLVTVKSEFCDLFVSQFVYNRAWSEMVMLRELVDKPIGGSKANVNDTFGAIIMNPRRLIIVINVKLMFQKLLNKLFTSRGCFVTIPFFMVEVGITHKDYLLVFVLGRSNCVVNVCKKGVSPFCVIVAD